MDTTPINAVLASSDEYWPQTIRVRPTVPPTPESLADSGRDRSLPRAYLDAYDARVATQQLITGHDFVWAIRSVTMHPGEPLEVEVYVLRSGLTDFEGDAQSMRDLVQAIVDGEKPRVYAGLFKRPTPSL